MNELDLFEKKMTIKELAETLNVSRDLIEKRTKELFPGKMKKGITTIFSIEEVTAVKLRIEENSSLATSDDRRKLIDMPKTQLEKNLLIQQAFNFLKEEESILRLELFEAKEQLQLQAPKVEFFDIVTKQDGWLSFKEVANILNIPELGRNNLIKKLRVLGYLNQFNKPYQTAITQKLFKVIESNANGVLRTSTVVSQKGLSRLINELKGGQNG